MTVWVQGFEEDVERVYATKELLMRDYPELKPFYGSTDYLCDGGLWAVKKTVEEGN